MATVNLGGLGGDIEQSPNGDITIKPPAAVAAAQAPPPNGQIEVPQPVAQIVINVPLSKLTDFLKLIEDWMSDEDWQHRQRGL